MPVQTRSQKTPIENTELPQQKRKKPANPKINMPNNNAQKRVPWVKCQHQTIRNSSMLTLDPED